MFRIKATLLAVALAAGLLWALVNRSGATAAAADSQPAASGPTVTLTGCLMCNRQCIAKKWDHKRDGPDHDVVLFAFDGPPELKKEVDSIMKEFWKGDTLDGEQARALQDEFTKRTKYYLAPTDLVKHSDIDYSTWSAAVTGTTYEKDGKKWISVTDIKTGSRNKPLKIPYPEKMLAPDKPMQMPDKEPLVLKITDKLSMKCIKLPAGKFFCGSPFYEVLRFQDEFAHMVTLTKPFYMAETLITQEMFEEVMGSNASKRVPVEPWKNAKDKGFKTRMRHLQPDEGKDFAVENTTWQEVQDFCKKISEKNGGLVVRVPTQAEWEWAARVGTSGPVFHEKYVGHRSYVGDKGMDGPEQKCEPVKKRPPNAWGVYDLVKSGWEWVSDYKLDNIREDAVDPIGPSREGAANHGSGPLRRMEGGVYYGDTHLTLHGAIDEAGDGEEGICTFRLVVEVPSATTASAPAEKK